MSTITKVTLIPKHAPTADWVNFNCSDLLVEHQISPSWSEENTYGKMDPIATFSHNARSMNVTMTMLANTIGQASGLQRSVDLLIKYLYPTYKAGGGGTPVLAAPPFFKIAMLHDKLYNSFEGYIKSINIKPGHGDDMVPLVSSSGMFFERKYTIDFAFTVLHQYLPGWIDGIEPGRGHGGFIYRHAEEAAQQKLATVGDSATAATTQQPGFEGAFARGQNAWDYATGKEEDMEAFAQALDLRASLIQFAAPGENTNVRDIMLNFPSPDATTSDYVANVNSSDTITEQQAKTPGPTQAQNSNPRNSKTSTQTSADYGVNLPGAGE